MKKALSLILALVMIFALATVAFAEDVIGTRGDPEVGDYTDGADAANATKEYNVSINVSTNQIISKYAVDVTYDSTPISLGGGKLTWDVNHMKYVITTNAGDPDPAELSRAVTVTNYSDKGIVVTVNVVDNYGAEDGLLITGDKAVMNIAGATPGVGANDGTEKSDTLTITVALAGGADWNSVATYYTNLNQGNVIQAGYATLNIAPAAP